MGAKDLFKRLVLIILFCLFIPSLFSCGGGGGGGTNPDSGPNSGNLPDLVITSFSAPSSGTAGGKFTVTGTVTNKGSSVAGGVGAIIYISPFADVTIDGGVVGMNVYMGLLYPGDSWNFSVDVELPSGIANGNYYIGAFVPYGDELDTTNNVSSKSITISGGTTCTPDSYEKDNSSDAARFINIGDIQQHNFCEGTSDWLKFNASQGKTYGIMTKRVSKAYTVLQVYDSDGKTLLATGSSESWQEFGESRLSWTAPKSGQYYIRVSPLGGMSSGGANTDYKVIFGEQQPDLIVKFFNYHTMSAVPGGLIYMDDLSFNQGFADAGSFDVSYYLSTDDSITANDTFLGKRSISQLKVGESNSGSSSYSLPSDITPGVYYVGAIVNPDNRIKEFSTLNNVSEVKQITIQPLGNCTKDQYEEDDSYTSAKVINVGEVQQHNLCDDNVDWLKFNAIAGKSYSIRSWTIVELYDSDGTTRLAGDFNNDTISIDWTAPKDGIYYIQAIGKSIGPGDYHIELQYQLPDLTQSLSVSSNTAIAGGSMDISDTVTNKGYAQSGPFEVGIYLSADATVTTSDMLISTRQISSLGSSGYNSSNYAWYTIYFPKTLAPGTYYLGAIADHENVIEETNENNNTSSSVTINIVNPPCPWDTYEDDDSIATAKSISAGETQSRNFCDDKLDWIKFIPSENGIYVANTSFGDSIGIYYSDGVTPVPVHDSYFDDVISWAANEGTIYLLKSYGLVERDYQFTVYKCNQDSFEEDDSYTDAKLISTGATQSRNLCDDGKDWAKFTAIQGTSYVIRTTNGDKISFSLYDTDGRTYIAGSQRIQGGKYQEIQWTATKSGTFYLNIRPSFGGFGQNLDYILSLN